MSSLTLRLYLICVILAAVKPILLLFFIYIMEVDN